MEEFPQVLGEGVRVNRISLGVGEQVRADLPVVLPGHALLEVVETPQCADHIVGDGHGPAAAIFGGAFHHTFPRHHAAGAGHHQVPGVVVHKGEVPPLQGAQLAPSAAGVDRQDVEGVVEDVLLGQSVEEVLGLLVRGNELFPPFRVRQVDHPGGVLRNDLVALGVAEDGGDHGQVLLHGGLLDGPALVGSLSQLYKQIFQRHRPQLPQLDGTDVGVDPLQHPPVAGQGAGGVLHLPLQPPGGIGFKGGVPVLGETGLHQALQLLRFVGNVLGDAPGLHRIRHGDGLGLADLLAVWAVAVADSNFEFAV